MNSMSELCRELLDEHSFEAINLRHFHQDIIENFFSLLRRALGSNVNPTAIETMRVIKSLIISKFSASSSKNSNCEKDDCKFLLNQQDWFDLEQKSKEKKLKLIQELSQSHISSINNDNNNSNSISNNAKNNNIIFVEHDENFVLLHIPDYESDNEAIVELIYAPDDMMPRIIARKMKEFLKKVNCDKCFSCFIKVDDEEECWEPTKKCIKLITDCFKIFQDKIITY